MCYVLAVVLFIVVTGFLFLKSAKTPAILSGTFILEDLRSRK